MLEVKKTDVNEDNEFPSLYWNGSVERVEMYSAIANSIT